MAGFGSGLSYLIAAQFQALALLGFGWWAGSWLNENHPKDGFNWMIVTMSFAVLATVQTFYVVIRKTTQDAKKSSLAGSGTSKGGT